MLVFVESEHNGTRAMNFRFSSERKTAAFVSDVLRLNVKAGYRGRKAAVLAPGSLATYIADLARRHGCR